MKLEPGPGIANRSRSYSGEVSTKLYGGDRRPSYRFHLDGILVREAQEDFFQDFDRKFSQAEPRSRHSRGKICPGSVSWVVVLVTRE